MKKIFPGILFLLCLFNSLAAQISFHGHFPEKPLLENIYELDTNSNVYKAANVSRSVDSVYYTYYQQVLEVNERNYSKNGYLLSSIKTIPARGIKLSKVYTSNKKGVIMKLEYKQSIMDSVVSHEIIEVLAVDNKNRPLRTIHTYPLKSLTRNTVQPRVLNNMAADQLKSKATIEYDPQYFSKVYRTYTYAGDTQKIVLCTQFLGNDTVQSDEYTLNSYGFPIKLKRWVYPDNKTKALSVYEKGLLTETQTYISGMKTEHTVFVYAPGTSNFESKYSCKVYSAVTSPRKYLFQLEVDRKNYTLTFPDKQTKIISRKGEPTDEDIDGLAVLEKEGGLVPQKVPDGNGYRIDYYYHSTVVRKEWYSENGLMLRFEGNGQVVYRSYFYH
ncbi:MAG: hypothetical protein ACK5Z2_18465 [Bacteroidota bacterium]|jgi:hypothetical protein